MNKSVLLKLKILSGIALLAIFSCTEKTKTASKDFPEKVVDFMIENADATEDKMIEIPRLYDSLATEIPKDSDEKLILTEILKKKGFEVTHWGRGNFKHGPRFISLTLTKDSCECRVDKMYYNGLIKGDYEMRESIQCKILK